MCKKNNMTPFSPFLLFSICLLIESNRATSQSLPHIIFLLTDDQSMDTLENMPRLRSIMGQHGTFFKSMYASIPVCCPSRASLWSGQFQHNNNVIGNIIETNCSSRTWQEQSEPNSVAVHLKSAGYSTSFAGKYLNDYGDPRVGGPQHVPPGWDNWQGLVGNSIYYDYTLSNNGQPEQHGHDYATDYLPDLVINRTLDFIDAKVKGGQPLFAVVSTPTCHDPTDPAPQYADLYPQLHVPRTPDYNATVLDTHWFQSSGAAGYGLDSNAGRYIDLKFRRRALTLITVEDILEALVQKMTDLGQLNNTYFVYTTDNGYHLGTYSTTWDKRQPWESDVLLPLFIRGPGVAAGAVSDKIVSMVDLSATFLALAGVSIPSYFDGTSLLDASNQKLMVLIEYHGEPWFNSSEAQSNDKFAGDICQRTEYDKHLFQFGFQNHTTPPFWYGNPICTCEDSTNNTWNCLRYRNDTSNFRYCEFADSVSMVEYFDYTTDPWGLRNAAQGLPSTLKQSLHQRLAEAVVCKGSGACADVLSRPLNE